MGINRPLNISAILAKRKYKLSAREKIECMRFIAYNLMLHNIHTAVLMLIVVS